MGGPQLEENFLPRGHGPPSFGGAGAQFSPRFEDVEHDFTKLVIDDKREKDSVPQRSKSTRRVSFNTSKSPPRRYECYAFTKRDDWRVADRIKIVAPQDELEKKVVKGKKSSSVVETLINMSSDRRAQIDRLVDQRNFEAESRDALWHCVFIDSPSPSIREIDGKRILAHKKMNVIIAQDILSGSAKSTSQERKKSFAGERSDISEPIRFKEKANDKDKPSKAGKDGKEGKEGKEGKGGKDSNDRRDDPFDSKPLFNHHGAPLDKHGPIPEYPQQLPPQFLPQLPPQLPPQHQPFDQGMGQPFGSPAGQPMGHSQPNGPAGHPVFHDPFPQPGPAQKLPYGMEVMDDPVPPQHGATNVFNMDEPLPPGKGNMNPHGQQPPFQRPKIDDFNGGGAPHRKQPNRPQIIQDFPKGQRHHGDQMMFDDSSRGSEDDFLFDEDERSSHTSYGDDHEKFLPRGSLMPHRHSSGKRRESTYREHHRGPSYPIQDTRRLEPRRPELRRPEPRRLEHRRDSRYRDNRGETIIERRPRRHSSRDRREPIKFIQPKRLEFQSRSPPLTPISNLSYSPPRRFSGLFFPHELDREREREREREYELERLAEEHIREKQIRDREEAVFRRERELDDRDMFERSHHFDRLGRRISGQGWSSR
jgi:hypothetical protein